MMLDLRSLRHLVVLARRLNYLRAADELGISQPTLSRSIQALEQRLHVRLFDRDRGGVSLTAQGRFIADRAALLLMDAEDLERHSRLSAQADMGRLRFGMAPMPARALLSRTLTERLTHAPGATHEVVVRDVEALWGMLTVGEVEFFVSPNPPVHDLSDVEVQVLGRFPFSLLVRAGHPMLEASSAAETYPLLRSSWTGLSVPEAVRPHISGAPNVIEDFQALAAITAATDALWLSSAFAVVDELRGGVLREFHRADQHLDVAIYALKRRSRSPLAAAVIATLQDQVDRIIQEDMG